MSVLTRRVGVLTRRVGVSTRRVGVLTRRVGVSTNLLQHHRLFLVLCRSSPDTLCRLYSVLQCALLVFFLL